MERLDRENAPTLKLVNQIQIIASLAAGAERFRDFPDYSNDPSGHFRGNPDASD
jgi:hypothetical protein